MAERNTVELQQESCTNCGGSGSIVTEVAGRTGTVPCPSCENTPEGDLPTDLPEDPEARIAELEQQLSDLEAKQEQIEEATDRVQSVQDDLTHNHIHQRKRHLQDKIRQLEFSQRQRDLQNRASEGDDTATNQGGR
jgi:uncharacterized Zn finger protein (UPF0148 family)